MLDISVIIPTYKPSDYLWECLNSLKKQTLNKNRFEIIIILNGCDEPFSTNIQNYIKLYLIDHNVKFIHTNVPGVSNARNIALEVCSGEYITFLDDDDSLSMSCLEEMLNKSKSDVVVECYPYAYKDGDISHQLKDSLTNAYDVCVEKSYHTINSFARKFFSGPCMKLFHKDIIDNRKFDIRFKNGEDSIYMFLLSNKIKRVEYTSRNAIYYRRYRMGSAINKNRSIKEKIINCIMCIIEYTKIYFKGGYSAYFYITRLMAETKSIIMYLLGKK